jgi:hypothetical protein
LSSSRKGFLNDLASKIAAGPPKKPQGLLKKPAVGAEAMDEADAAAGADARAKMAAMLNRTAPAATQKNAENAEDKIEDHPPDEANH